MSEYIRVNYNFLPENQTHMSVYNEIMEAKKNKNPADRISDKYSVGTSKI